ncbi:MAG: RNA methyltransferase [Candidatus Schekmanbacteria bacterium]|nr:MAG: RNA methyltransferase [Candidatus Schekmanbacteria bacterium]
MKVSKKVEKTPPLYIALIHYPVINKDNEIIGTSITNLDIHDLSRTSATYGIKKFFMVTPFDEQNKLLERIVEHWTKGKGAEKNPLRAKALETVEVVKDFDDVLANIKKEEKKKPLIISTTARKMKGALSYKELKEQISQTSSPILLLFGTGWGIAGEILKKSDIILKPIEGKNGYNHLSVRCASAIIIDRLFGSR